MQDGGVQGIWRCRIWRRPGGTLISRHSHDLQLAVGGELVAAWSQLRRRYHSVAHLMDILVRVSQLADHADDPDAVRLAAWYHDCVYEGLPDDEERSARRAEEDLSRLGVAPAMVDEVARLVRMTVTHDPAPGDHNGEVLSDADLAALALPRDLYRMNSAAITAERPHPRRGVPQRSPSGADVAAGGAGGVPAPSPAGSGGRPPRGQSARRTGHPHRVIRQ